MTVSFLQRHVPFRGLIQVAGIHDMAEAVMLAECGFHSLGFPLRLPVNREDCTEEEAAKMAVRLGPRIAPVCICYLDQADAIDTFCTALGMVHVQLHGPVPSDELERLRRLRPDLYVIKSLVIRDTPDALQTLNLEAAAAAPHVDAFITDTHNPATGADGATGMTHDWSISRSLVASLPRPVILAGGLTPDNVSAAILAVQPAGVDVHSGIEAPDGRKDRNRSLRFVREANEAFTKISAICS